jgi:TldD protein
MTAHDWGDLAGEAAANAVLDTVLSAVDGVGYADVRLVEGEELRTYHQLGRDPVERVEQTIGIGVRVLVDGAGRPVRLPPREPASGSYATEVRIDPFAVPTAERDTLLQRTIAAARVPGVISVQCGVNAKRQHRHFASTEGSRQHQSLVETGGMLVTLAAGDGGLQRRSYPDSFHGNTSGSGWEFVLGLDLPGNAPRVGAEAAALLSARTAPAGEDDLMIGAQQVSLQIHESAGHALELDRMLGDERNFAGASFISVADVGSLHYGSPAGPDELRIFGCPCGKGEPKQWGFLSHAAAPLLVRGVRTGVA